MVTASADCWYNRLLIIMFFRIISTKIAPLPYIEILISKYQSNDIKNEVILTHYIGMSTLKVSNLQIISNLKVWNFISSHYRSSAAVESLSPAHLNSHGRLEFNSLLNLLRPLSKALTCNCFRSAPACEIEMQTGRAPTNTDAANEAP